MTPHEEKQAFKMVSDVLVRYEGTEETALVPDGTIEIAGKQRMNRVYDANRDIFIYPYADGAFTGIQHLRSVQLPSTLRRIGTGAFSGCTGLTSVVIPEGVTSIEPETFRDCTSLQSVILPKSLLAICDHAFDNCIRLQRVQLPGQLRKIGTRAFSYCTGLQELHIPDSVDEIGALAFEGCRNLSALSFNNRLSEALFQGSKWYIDRQICAGRCPVCGEKLSSENNICRNVNCPTNYGKWER